MPDIRSTLHARLTVAPGAGRGRQVGARVVGPEELHEAATVVAGERSAERVAVRARLDAATARALHDLDAATDRVAAARAMHQRLLDAADWAMRAHGELDAHHAAIEGARTLFETRRGEQRAARERLDRVLEQRAAAAVAMQDADQHVGDLDGIGMDEMGLRRELEAAGEAARTTHAAHAAAVAAVQRLAGEQEALDRRATKLREQLAGRTVEGTVPVEQVARVEKAVAEWTRAARGGGVDNYSQALADAFTELLADLAEHDARRGPTPDASTIESARAAANAAAAALRRIESAVDAAGLTPDQRAEIDAAHAAVVEAAERAERKLARSGAQRKLEAAQAAEQELLAQLGFGGYLEVVLSGGRSAAARPERAAAEQAYVAAQSDLDRLMRMASEASPELEHLESERARLLAHVVDRLGVDPGDQVVPLLRSHPMLPSAVVDELRQALAAIGVFPVGVGLADAAMRWLEEQSVTDEASRVDRAEVEAIDNELATVVKRSGELISELAAARAAEAEAVEQFEMATRSVGAVEAELTNRTGEDTTRYQRYVAAQQLRAQVEALSATLAHAEHEASTVFDAATHAAEDAEVALDRARAALDDVARRARALADELPTSHRPVGDRLDTLVDLAARLQERAREVLPTVAEAEADVALISDRVDAARAAAEAAGTGLDGPRPEDVHEALDRLLRFDDGVLVLDEPFAKLEPEVRGELCRRLTAGAGPSQVVLLTDDPATLGWAIGLPEEQAAVVSTDSVLNLLAPAADTMGTDPAGDDAAARSTARLSVGPH